MPVDVISNIINQIINYISKKIKGKKLKSMLYDELSKEILPALSSADNTIEGLSEDHIPKDNFKIPSAGVYKNNNQKIYDFEIGDPFEIEKIYQEVASINNLLSESNEMRESLVSLMVNQGVSIKKIEDIDFKQLHAYKKVRYQFRDYDRRLKILKAKVSETLSLIKNILNKLKG